MADDPWAVVSVEPATTTQATPVLPAASGDPWAVVDKKPAASAIPSMTIRPDPAAASAQAPKMMSHMDRIATGMADPIHGGVQLLTHVLPDAIVQPVNRLNNYIADKTGLLATIPPGGVDELEQNREAGIQATTPPTRSGGGTTLDAQGRASHQPTTETRGGIDPDRLLGDMLSPVNLALPKWGQAGGLVARTSNAALQGATIGALQPVTNPEGFKTQKLLQMTLGAATGAVIPPIGAAGRAVYDYALGLHGADAAERKAVQSVLDRIRSNPKGEAATLQDMLDIANAAPDKPLVLGDVGPPHMRSMMGSIARTPGAAKDIMAKFVIDRDLDAGTRVSTDINENVGGGAAFYADRALIDARSKAAAPLFEKADEGGSIAPLERQFQNAFADAGRAEKEAAEEVAHAQTKITQAAARQTQAGNNVYANSGANQDMRAAHAEFTKASAKLTQAGEAKAEILEQLRQAQDDIATNKPGAVWSPAIARWLQNPRVKIGIQQGLRIARDEADAALRPVDATEYATLGIDANGEPIVGRVPNFRLLRIAKQGMDAMLDSPQYKSELSGKLNTEGVGIKQLRDAFVAEMDRLNPEYKVARDAWSGPSQSVEALRLGQDIFKMEPEAIADAFGNMASNDKEFFRLGAANTMRKLVQQTGEKGDETRRLIGSEYAKRQMRAMFNSQADFDKFFRSLNAEHMMFDTWRKAYGGSETAERIAEDFGPSVRRMGHAVRGAVDLAHGNVGGAIVHGSHFVSERLAKGNPDVAAAQARLLTTPVPEAIARLRGATTALPPVRHITPGVLPIITNETQPDFGGP